MKCIGTEICGLCLAACKFDAIKAGEPAANLKGEPVVYPVVDREKCTVCLECAKVCPSKGLYDTKRHVSVEDCMKSIRQDKRYYEKSGGGVTISGGEPMSQFEFCKSLAKACNDEGFTVALDTTGFAPTERYLEILPYVDLFLYDLKHMDSAKSEKLTGVPNGLIKKNAIELAKAGAHFQIRYPIIPKLNDSESNIKATAEFCKAIQDSCANGGSVDVVQLLPFHKMGQTKYQRLGKKYRMNASPPSGEFMEAQRELFVSYGLPAQIG
jgi:pyruvate formate lyase activating enzyme